MTIASEPLPLPNARDTRASAEPLRTVLARHLGLEGEGSSLVQTIALGVAELIVRGELRFGQDLNSVDLARRFNASRTPVKEALLLLERHGLAEVKARLRPRVARVSLATVQDIYHCYAILSSYVSELVAAKVTTKELQVLRGFHREMVRATEADDTPHFILAITEIRDYSNEIAGNAVVRQMLDMLSIRRLQLRHLLLGRYESRTQACADHGRLLLAYEAHDSALAAALQKAMVLDALRALALNWEKLNTEGTARPARKRKTRG